MMQVRNKGNRQRNFDFDGFLSAVDAYRVRKDKSWRQVSKETEVSASSLTRMAQGKRLDIDGLVALSSWAGLELEVYYRKPMQDSGRAATVEKMTALLRADPNLNQQDAEHLESLIRASYDHFVNDGSGDSDEP